MRWYNRFWTLACVGIATSAVAGCEGDIPGSNVVDTDQIYADIQVVGGDESTDVGVLMKQGGADGTLLTLVPGDELRASLGGKQVSRFTKDGSGRYHATLKGSATGAKVTVGLDRSEADSANNSTAVLPEAFSLQLDMDGAELARGNDVPLVWDAASSPGDITWSVKGTCVESTTGTLKDDGSGSIGTGQIKLAPGNKGTTCDVSISLERSAPGTLDPKFGKGGQIVAYQRRTVTLSSTPGIEEQDSY
jgi:hypothetical protein